MTLQVCALFLLNSNSEREAYFLTYYSALLKKMSLLAILGGIYSLYDTHTLSLTHTQ
jgi:hypothetical protein